jgi:hypothetical protein
MSGTEFLTGVWTTRIRGSTKQIEALVLRWELGGGSFGRGLVLIATSRSGSGRDLQLDKSLRGAHKVYFVTKRGGKTTDPRAGDNRKAAHVMRGVIQAEE